MVLIGTGMQIILSKTIDECINCKNCGAISGLSNKNCEYCGSELIRRPAPPECVNVRE